MTNRIGKHYTYKVTFPGMPWYYFGVHTENGKLYFGSPKTHKWIWKIYEHEIQILEWFDDRREAEKVEDRIIAHFIRDQNCLNEHYGGFFSEDCRRKGRKKQKEMGVGVYSPDLHTFEHHSNAGKAGIRETILRNPNHQRDAGRIIGAINKESGHLDRIRLLRDPEEHREHGKRLGEWAVESGNLNRIRTPEHQKAAFAALLRKNPDHQRDIALQKWGDPDHPELGQHNAGVLTRKQKALGYPHGKENRVRVE
jgi:hypothetical protein